MQNIKNFFMKELTKLKSGCSETVNDFTKVNLCSHFVIYIIFWYHAIDLADWFTLIVIY